MYINKSKGSVKKETIMIANMFTHYVQYTESELLYCLYYIINMINNTHLAFIVKSKHCTCLSEVTCSKKKNQGKMAYNDRNINKKRNIQKHKMKTFVFKETMVATCHFCH